jgi:HPt (histidine-containing phosphotransfer) domain-containing protein
MPPPKCGKLPDWDDETAMTALGGQRVHVEAMRQLFLKELPAQRARIEQAAGCGDQAAVRAELHRLAASCGFVGAARLADAVRMLREVPLDHACLQRFGFAADDLLASA